MTSTVPAVHGVYELDDDPARVDRDAVWAFLATEVPRWSRENHCYSCHNNGDSARALLAAKKRGLILPEDALRGTPAAILPLVAAFRKLRAVIGGAAPAARDGAASTPSKARAGP